MRGPDVVKFLLEDPLFPRTVYHCLNQMEFCLQKLPAPKNAEILEGIAELKQAEDRNLGFVGRTRIALRKLRSIRATLTVSTILIAVKGAIYSFFPNNHR